MNIVVNLVMHTLVQEPLALVYALAGPDTHFNICVHSMDEDVNHAAHTLEQVVPNLQVEYVGFNRGLAYSYNEMFVRSMDADIVVVVNDDIVASRYDLMLLANGAIEHPEAYMITIDGLHVEPNVKASLQIGFGAFTRTAFDTLGAMDENLMVLYWEDSDYYFRAHRSGLHTYSAGDSGVLHLGSQTMRRNPDADRQVRASVPRNEAYILEKWGGTLNNPAYWHPFNDPGLGQKIEFANRHNPYGPKYDRTDYDEVMAL